MLVGDKLRLKQVLVNLVKNALRFGCGKEIRIGAQYDSTEELLSVKVIDKGQGIGQEKLSELKKYFSH